MILERRTGGLILLLREYPSHYVVAHSTIFCSYHNIELFLFILREYLISFQIIYILLIVWWRTVP